MAFGLWTRQFLTFRHIAIIVLVHDRVCLCAYVYMHAGVRVCVCACLRAFNAKCPNVWIQQELAIFQLNLHKGREIFFSLSLEC